CLPSATATQSSLRRRSERSLFAAAMLVALHRLPGDVAPEFLAIEGLGGGQEFGLLVAQRVDRLIAHAQRRLVGKPRHVGVEAGLGPRRTGAAIALDHPPLVVGQRCAVTME